MKFPISKEDIKHPIKSIKGKQLGKGNNLASDHTARNLNRYLVAKANLKDAPVKNSLQGAGVGALLGGTTSALSYTIKVRRLAKKLRQDDPSLSYADALKKAKEILGSFKSKFKEGAFKGGLVGAVAGGATTAGLRYKANRDRDIGRRNLAVEKYKKEKQLAKEAKYIEKHADVEHRQKLADSRLKLAQTRAALLRQAREERENKDRRGVYRDKFDTLLDKLTRSKEQREFDGYKSRKLFDKSMASS